MDRGGIKVSRHCGVAIAGPCELRGAGVGFQLPRICTHTILHAGGIFNPHPETPSVTAWINNMHSISIISHIAARCPVTNQRHTTTSKCRTMVQRSSENTPHSTDAGVTASHGRQSSPLPQAQSSFSTRSSCCTVSSSSEVTVEPRWRERRLPRGAFLATVSIERRSLSGDRRGPSGDTMVG